MNVYGVTWPPELLTRAEVARILSTSERRVSELTAEGHLTRVDDGGKRIKYRLSDVRTHIAHLPPASDADPATYPPELLTKSAAAQMLMVSPRRVAELIATRALPSVDIRTSGSPNTRIRLADLRSYIEGLPERA